MREYKEEKRETVVDGRVVDSRVNKKLIRVTCSLCGTEARDADNERSRWGDSNYSIEEVGVFYKTGGSYPEGGNYESKMVDICPDCFETKVLPWLVSQGAVIETGECDW